MIQSAYDYFTGASSIGANGQVVFWLLLSTRKLQICEQKQWQAEGGTKQPVMALTTIQERR